MKAHVLCLALATQSSVLLAGDPVGSTIRWIQGNQERRLKEEQKSAVLKAQEKAKHCEQLKEYAKLPNPMACWVNCESHIQEGEFQGTRHEQYINAALHRVVCLEDEDSHAIFYAYRMNSAINTGIAYSALAGSGLLAMQALKRSNVRLPINTMAAAGISMAAIFCTTAQLLTAESNIRNAREALKR